MWKDEGLWIPPAGLFSCTTLPPELSGCLRRTITKHRRGALERVAYVKARGRKGTQQLCLLYKCCGCLFFSWSCGRCVGIASSRLRGETGKSSLFSSILLKPSAICSEAREAFPRFNCQSNAKYIGALLIIPPLRGFALGFCFKLSANPATSFGEKLPVFFWQWDDCSVFHGFPP